MAFVLALEDLESEIEAAFLSNPDESIARICIGHDDETGNVYSVFVALVKSTTVPGRSEIFFNVIEACAHDDEAEDDWLSDGSQTLRFLKGDHRKVVLSCICMAVQRLVDRSRPEVVYMMTVTPNLPEKALRKYDIICSAMRDVGYETGRDSPYHGSAIWLANRIA